MSRPFPLLVAGALLVGASALVEEPDAEGALAHEAQRLQRTIDRSYAHLETSAAQLCADLEAIGPKAWLERHVLELESERRRTGTVYLGFRGGGLVCWSGPSLRDAPGPVGTGQVIAPDGIWSHAMASSGDYTMHALRPVWRTPPIENRYLQRGFHPSLEVAAGLVANDSPSSGPALVDRHGRVMLHLAWRDGALEMGRWLHLRLGLLFAGLALLMTGLWVWSMRVVRTGRPLPGFLLFLAATLVLRLSAWAIVHWGPLDRLPLFDPAVYATSALLPSLGDMLMNTLTLLLCMAFLHRITRHTAVLSKGHLAVFLVTFALLLQAALTTWLVTGLVDDSSIELDPYHVQGLDVFSLLALTGMMAALAAWLFAASAWAASVLAGKRIGNWIPGVAVGIACHLLLWQRIVPSDLLGGLWPIPLLVLMVLVRTRGPRFTQVVAGLALLAAVSAYLLDRRTTEREGRERLVLAERLATREDPVVEQLFREMSPGLRRDRGVYAMLSGQRPCAPGDLDRQVRQRFFSGWWERYDVRLFAFGQDGRLVCATDADPPRSFQGTRDAFADPAAISDTPDLFIEEQTGRSPFYHARVAVMPVDSLPPGQLIVELYPRSAAQGLGFPTLLLAGDDPLARRSERYAYARYENGRLVERSGAYAHPLKWHRTDMHDGHVWFDGEGYRHLAKGDPNGTLIMLSRPIPGPLDRATAFSYLFALYSLVLATALALHGLWRARGLPVLGIGAKVRLALVLFAIAGLFFFGVGTQRLLTRQYDQRFEKTLLEKARSVHQELQQRLDGEPVLNISHAAYLDHLLARMSNVFFTDIIVYDVQGLKLSTSRPQIFATGLLGPRMDPVAFTRVVIGDASIFTHEESIGNANYRAAYLPLRDRGGQVLAYLALPGFADQAQREQERADVLVAVVNLFALLFALSVVVAVIISNWTTRPLDLLKNALARVGLQQANEPIRYRGDDEIGQLVEVYNRKVEELRESAELLARSERESAWREMARQVAHEIKNPLTPMKLSIQHFQRTWKPDTVDASEKLDRFSRGLVEQIDTLSGIASAFSNFAEMPRTHAQALDLAEVAEAALTVFHATPGIHCDLRRTGSAPLPVHADREQLLRVFNNLLKNAVQSIPDGRDGRIAITLRRTKDEAVAEVRDNGIGIREEDRERIFRPNFTTKSSGMGLGLAMVQRMVENAGGRVWFESCEGEGSTFFVALPLSS
ncbi:MAG: HAMP domain-containing histidine kinase [Flavobacteriales bacterium]|nr:HAMP domain-containing histidine kinase [Flavobacteriales bacterium]